MTHKTQAGLEFIAIMAILLIFLIGINNIFLRLNIESLVVSKRESMVSHCLDFNTLISKSLTEPGLTIKFENNYELEINSTARLITIFYENDSYTCGLITSRLANESLSKEFTMIIGEKKIINNESLVMII